MTSDRAFFPLVIAFVLLVATIPAPVAGTTGTVTSETSDVATPDSEITLSFDVTNTDVETAAYFLDVSLPEGWTVVDHNGPEDVTWSPDKSEWFIQAVSPDGSISPSVTVAVPSDASRAGTIETVLRSRTGVQWGTTDTIEVYQNENQVRVANPRLSPTTVTENSQSHILTFDAFSVSADGEPDNVSISLPDDVRLRSIEKVDITNQPYEVNSTMKEDHSITLEINPDESVNTVHISFQIKARLSTTSNGNR